MVLHFLTDLFKPKPAKAAPITSETSMNFDLAEIAPFLTRMEESPRFTLPQEFAATLADAMSALEVDQTRRWRIDGDFDGEPILLEIEAFMDDRDAPDLGFFSSAPVIAEIDRMLRQLEG